MFSKLRRQFKHNQNKLPNPIKPDGSRASVYVGVSGGVDSSVSAALLRDAGFDVTGVFIEVYHPEKLGCSWRDERLDAMRVCEQLNIPFLDLDLQKEYKKDVFDYMVEGYRRGETPNPDVFCNKYVKFGGFLQFALDNNIDYVATGHYCQHKFEKNGADKMLMGADKNKDQTYFLWTTAQEKLQKILFPIGHLEKPAVRKLAEKYNLHNQNKKDSQGICFLGKVNMKDFLKNYIDERPGDVLDIDGNAIGSHPGVLFFTLGERHGFSIDPKNKTPNTPKLFILSKDLENNTITVGPKESMKSMAQNNETVRITEVNWIGDEPQEAKIYQARIRYRGVLHNCKLAKNDGNWTVLFNDLPDSVTQGQSLVIYDKDICVGGGIISK